MLVSHGSRDGGYVLFVQDNHVHYVHNYLGVIEVHAVSTAPLPKGPVHIRFEFAPMERKRFGISRGTPGRATLFVDDRLVGEKELPVTLPFGLAIGGGVCVGRAPECLVSIRTRACDVHARRGHGDLHPYARETGEHLSTPTSMPSAPKPVRTCRGIVAAPTGSLSMNNATDAEPPTTAALTFLNSTSTSISPTGGSRLEIASVRSMSKKL